MRRETITVKRFFDEYHEELGLKLIAGNRGVSRIIPEPTINRPGLVLAGFTEYFSYKRVQVIGNAETYFLRSRSEQERQASYERLFSFRIPCVVFSRNLHPDDRFLAMAQERQVPIFRTHLATVTFINKATIGLEYLFAPHGTEMGSMVDILGVGVIIRGESGIGKSECVLALIERGYSLVSDDVTRVTLVEGHEVLGSSDEKTRDFMEVRGIGIINVAKMFGVRSIRQEKRVDLVVTLMPWEKVPDVERVGMNDDYTTILGVQIPHMVIPVRPGRDLARLIEVAAFHTKLKAAGYNPAEELNKHLIEIMSQQRSGEGPKKQLTRSRGRGN
ncbi:HPr(Ser) kinase/phosphatase [Fontisphaera persica]|uniref:HPr(Ser) kinase/phosphatase n=1 Tax=Fontisphaera persica TaxID=2974023 RepID=UPI0024BF5674|nr:HPr(Ser) kinase/phosphatase [Fontisphaera persica]WCJ59950.1 HPr(Ser) kinase/phosphatase [Fontisphaera persica]